MRCRPRRPAIATSPRIMRNSSIWVTLRLSVHPDRRPRHRAGVGDVAGQQRPGGREPVEDVATKPVVAPQPLARRRVRGRGRHGRKEEPQVTHRPHHRVELEERPVLLQGLLQMGRLVRRPEAAPRDQVGARRDRGGRVDLQECQPAHDLDEVGRSRGVQQLGTNGDPPRLFETESMDCAHVARIPKPGGPVRSTCRRPQPGGG